jgi:hypothetical protein
MELVNRELHPVYGAIPSDGEFVRQGEVLGLSTDATEVVLAPVSGWVKLEPQTSAADPRLVVRIHASRGDSAGLSPDSPR